MASTIFTNLLNKQSEPFHRARMLAASAQHSGDWLHALPITACGLRLSDDAVRIAVGLRLGCKFCEPHKCFCGAVVDESGRHGLSCRRSAGRIARHHYINDLLWRALSRAGVPAVKEPAGLSRSDGKRPDGMTLIPWREGRSVLWDVTIRDTTADSYLSKTSSAAGAAAEEAAEAAVQKESKYADLCTDYLFCSVAIETLGPICSAGRLFLSELGRRASLLTCDPRETAFLYQRVSVAVQRFNAVCVAGTFLPAVANT